MALVAVAAPLAVTELGPRPRAVSSETLGGGRATG
jgi:hypothetical protein